MNASQESQFSMFRAVESHIDLNLPIIAILPAFQTSFVLFKSYVAELVVAIQKEDLVTKGITISKGQAKKELCGFATDVAGPIFAFAERTKNSQLKKEVSFSYSKLLQTKDDALVPRIKNIYDVGVANLSSLADYGLTAEILETLSQMSTAYMLKVPNPRNAAASKKTVRENIKSLMKETNGILKNQMDKSILIIKKTNPDFVSTYTANRVIIDPAKGQTQLKGKITDSITKKGVQGVTVAIDNFTVTSDALGKYQINNMRLGSYPLKVTALGFKQVPEANFLIKQGQINNFNVVLEKEAE